MRRFVFLNSMQSICARLRRPARGKNSATKINKQIAVTRRGSPLLLACAVCLLLLSAADSQRPDDLTVHVHVIWTGNVNFNRSEGKNQVEENDQITITYDVTSHKTAPAGTPPWGIYPGTDNYQFTVSGGGSDTALQPRLAERRETCPRLAFQLPQMQNRRAIVPFRNVSPLIKGSLGDQFSTC